MSGIAVRSGRQGLRGGLRFDIGGEAKGQVATVFGATGQLGRAVAARLGQIGISCVMPNHGCEMEVRPLKPLFDLGEKSFPFYNFNDDESVQKAIAGSDIVINLVGKHYETKHIVPTRRSDGSLSRINCSFDKVNRAIPGCIAKHCRELGVRQLIHVSALASDPDSPSEWAKTKYAGELEVRSAFPDATIVRPSKMFGARDRFLNWVASLCTTGPRLFPMVGDGNALIQPVHVEDVAEGIISCIDNDLEDEPNDPTGKVLELMGNEEYTWDEIVRFISDIINRPYTCQPVHLSLKSARQLGWLLEQVPPPNGPIYTIEDAVQQTISVVRKENSDALTFEDLGITPTRMEDVAFSYIHRFRQKGHFALVKGYHSKYSR
eukprot:189940_1